MRMAPVQRRAFTYKVTTPAAALAVSLDDVKLQLHITDDLQNDILTIYINAATIYAEKLTRRDFINRSYTTFRDAFPGVGEGYYQFGDIPISGNVSVLGGNVGFELRKSALRSITTIKHLVNDLLVTVADSVYYNTVEEDYSEVLTKADQEWPDNTDARLQAIEIVFVAGFGAADTDMPKWVTLGIMQHVANLFYNRGDCSCEADIKNNLPPAARMLYMQNRIENL